MIVLFDTCALVSLANPADKFHAEADECYRLLKKGKHRLLASVISVAEFGVKDDIKSITSWGFRVPAFGTNHAAKAAQFARVTSSKALRTQPYDRQFIYADTQILAQAEVEHVDFILTRDEKTFEKSANALIHAGMLAVKVVKLNNQALLHLGLDSQARLF